ncbi:response regulator [Eubacteriales bacterium mix99]|jgi:DNA-binding NarL/FixJ family response regulator
MQAYKSEEEIVCASSIENAMEILKAHTVHTAFVDIYLGAENGLDLLAWVKKQKMKTNVFIITSSSRQSDFAKARALGADAYVLKDAFLDEIICGLKVVEKGGRFYSTALIDKMGSGQKQNSLIAT